MVQQGHHGSVPKLSDKVKGLQTQSQECFSQDTSNSELHLSTPAVPLESGHKQPRMVTSYFLAGCYKLSAAGLNWMDGTVLQHYACLC